MLSLFAAITLSVAPCADPRLAAIEAPGELPDGGTTEGYARLEHHERRVFLGVGHLRPDTAHSWGWLERTVMPVFDAPHGEIRAWLAKGWRVDPATGELHPFAGTGWSRRATKPGRSSCSNDTTTGG